MQIPDREFWAGIIMAVGAAVGFSFKTTKQMGKFLTREEHEKICEKHNEDLKEKMESVKQGQKEIKEYLQEQLTETREYRDRISNSLHTVGLNVAVIQTKLGMQNERDRSGG